MFRPLVLLPGETILFGSAVETRTLRRRASMLIPIPVAPIKAKPRQLILTTHRLVSLKRHHKGGGTRIKLELTLRATDKRTEKEKEKEARSVVASVEPKGEREFVVITVRICHLFLPLLNAH